ncbi:MAG: lysophospholipid acyltransferase family protein [Burkholderiaceae bacterium]|nr:MAG: lysophospholipid acyltransferase family protein [Burkholderiaceae bacterium]
MIGSFAHWMSRRPLGQLHAFGAFMGQVVYALSPTYRERFKALTAQAGVSPADAKQAVKETGKMVAELPWLWLRPHGQALPQTVRWEGAELLAQAYEQGKGVVLLTPHLGCFEVTAQAIAEKFAPQHGPLTVLYRPARQPWLRALIEYSRKRPGLATAPADLSGVRQLVRALKQGRAVGVLPDQVPPEGMGVWVPFFGRQAYTMTLGARLALQTGAIPLLIWGDRLPGGSGYVVRVESLPQALSGDLTQACQQINEAMEHLILKSPSQYLWGYHRYKTPRSVSAPPSPGASE